MQAENAIEVRNVAKTYRITPPNPTTGKGRGRLPFSPREELQVLKGVSFDVRHGEFFGVVGRNGSGKSTLLKLLADVYAPTRGAITHAGRVAPVLELGVGFSPEMSARDNAVINAVMLGLSRSEARAKVDRILEFAEIEEFAESKLKNLSAGMKVRLAFATMLAIDPEILLIDEVLAVGDAAFQEKCAGAMMDLRDRGRTIVLVTHSMPDVERLCDRALMLEDGRVEIIGEPDAVAGRYMEINLARRAGIQQGEHPEPEQKKATIVDLDIRGADTGSRTTVRPGEGIEVAAKLEVERVTQRPAARLEIRNERRGRVYVSPPIPLVDGGEPVLRPRERPSLVWRLENRLVPGRYTATLTITRIGRGGGDTPVSAPVTVLFAIAGEPRRGSGVVDLEGRVELRRDEARVAGSRW